MTGNLVLLAKDGEFDFIAHGANCMNVMGAGVALAIKGHFPEAFEVDENYSLELGEDRLGNYSMYIATLNDRMQKERYFKGLKGIVNFYTQLTPGPTFDEAACRLAMRKFARQYGGHGFTLGLPLIGCGYGGGTWDEVKPIIQEELSNHFEVVIVNYTPERQIQKRIAKHASENLTDV